MAARSDELPALTGLRGLAALAVLLGHAGWFTYGWLGVDVFFWLSGTVLAWVYQGGLAIGPFLWARVARIYPCVIVATALSVAAWLAVGRSVSPVDVASLLLVVPLVGWRAPLNIPAWSLAVEAVLYLLFPLLSALIGALSMRGRAIVAIVCLEGAAAIVWLSLGTAGYICGPPAVLRGLLPFTAGIAMLPLTLRVLGRGGRVIDLLDSRPCRWLGDVSLSLYLVQAAAFVLLPGLAGAALSLAVAQAVHYGVERPARRWLRSLSWATRPVLAR